MAPTTINLNVAAPILDVLNSQPRRLAIREAGGQQVDFQGLRARIVGLADHLHRLGMQPGDRVVLQVPNGITFAAAAVAVLLRGGVPVLCEPGLGDAIYQSRIRAANPAWLLVHPVVQAVNRIPGLRSTLGKREIDVPPLPDTPHRTVVVTHDRLERFGRNVDLAWDPCVERSKSDEAILVFTGGTTSAPKGVILSHGALEFYLSNIASVIEGMSVERFLADTPQQVLYALRLGRSAFTTKGRKARRARHILRLVREGSVDAYFGSPYVWVEMMSREGPAPARLPATLRTVLLGSAPVSPGFLQRLLDWLHPDTRTLVLYGLTEVGPVCAVRGEDKAHWKGPGDLVGSPLPGIELSIARTDESNDVGEIIIRSPSLFSGYLGQPAADRAVGFRTGDLGRLATVAGVSSLVLMGRSKDMIIRRGVNLYPASVEDPVRALRDARGDLLLRECALIGLWNPRAQDEEVCLCYQPAKQRPDESALRSAVQLALGPDGAPDHYLCVETIPVTGRQNKVDKAALRDLAAQRLGLRSSRYAGTGDPNARWRQLPGTTMPFGWSAFARKYRLLARNEGNLGAVAGQLVFRLALLAASQTGWAADELVAPRWRDAAMRGPIFILGHQRSGTTFLHRLLAADHTHARALSLHEMLLPSVSWQRMLESIARIDARRGGSLRVRFDAVQDRLFGPLDDIHRLRFDEIEEDEFVLWGIFASVMCVNDAPSSTALSELDDLRSFDAWTEQRQASALGYYRACTLKKAYREPSARGDAVWLVSKNPAFTHKTRQLRQVFEDARFIYLVRDPRITIPSRLSLIRAIWRRRFPGFRDMSERQVDVILRDSYRTYLAAERDLPELPEDRVVTVRFDELRNDPREVVRRIYETFGLGEPDADLDKRLDEVESRPRVGASRHVYSLEEFNLSATEIERQLAVVFAHYGF